MSYYDNQQWSAAGQPSWEHQTPPARSGASSVAPREDSTAFSSQLEEVDRAVDNLFKSGKGFGGPPAAGRGAPMGGPSRGGQFQDFDPRLGAGGPPRPHTGSDFGGDARTYSGSNLQNFYANQRHQPSRASETEQLMQAKRRMAAQRERELRNYHQEQQYNRSATAELSPFGGKPDRTVSPAGSGSQISHGEQVERQRKALFGESSLTSDNGSFGPNDEASRPGTQGSNPQLTGRGHSPLNETQGNGQSQGQRSRANSTSSPAANANNFSVFDNVAQQSSRTSNSSPGGSPPRQGKAASGSVAPIGTRPAAPPGQAVNPALNKRSTTPLPSPLSYGFAAGDESKGNNSNNGTDRSTSAASNPALSQDGGLGWGSKSGVWGKNPLGVQASVWG